jgi:hypothetical protein
VSGDPVAEANEILRAMGYKEPQLAVHVAPLPGRVLLKGSKMLSPFSDSPETVLDVVRHCVPTVAQLGARTLTPHELRAWLDQAGSST